MRTGSTNSLISK